MKKLIILIPFFFLYSKTVAQTTELKQLIKAEIFIKKRFTLIEKAKKKFQSAIDYYLTCIKRKRGCSAKDQEALIDATNALMKLIAQEIVYRGASVGEQLFEQY